MINQFITIAIEKKAKFFSLLKQFKIYFLIFSDDQVNTFLIIIQF